MAEDIAAEADEASAAAEAAGAEASAVFVRAEAAPRDVSVQGTAEVHPVQATIPQAGT